MTIRHLKSDPAKTIPWSKGTSSEIFIYPLTGNFQTRDFLFRISTATVEAEETVFTSFPKITRTLMVLKGDLTLTHKGHHTQSMLPFEQDTFQGDWETSSRGIVTDFNLMCQAGAVGTVKHIHMPSGLEAVCLFSADFELIYLQSGMANYNGKQLEAGDCLVIENGSGNHMTLSCTENCDFIQTAVNLV